MDATPTACVATGRILDAAAFVHAVMKGEARTEGPEGPKLLCFELAYNTATTPDPGLRTPSPRGTGGGPREAGEV